MNKTLKMIICIKKLMGRVNFFAISQRHYVIFTSTNFLKNWMLWNWNFSFILKNYLKRIKWNRFIIQPAASKIMYFWLCFFTKLSTKHKDKAHFCKDLIICIQECSLQWHTLRKTRLRRGLDQTTWKPPCNLEYLHREGDKTPREAIFIFMFQNIIFELYPVNLHKKINCIRFAIFPFNFFDTPQHRFTLQSHGWNVLTIFHFSLQLCFTSIAHYSSTSKRVPFDQIPSKNVVYPIWYSLSVGFVLVHLTLRNWWHECAPKKCVTSR